MVKVKAKRNFYGAERGSVRRGETIEVSETSARALKQRGLVIDSDDDNVPVSKSAPEAQNKMQPSASNKSYVDPDDEYEPGIVRSTANDLGAGGAQASRSGRKK
jgi:hypothetical protein